jgi:hypothetical protein
MITISLLSCAARKATEASKQQHPSKIFMIVLHATRSNADSNHIDISIERHFWADGKLTEEVLPSNDINTPTSANQWNCLFFDQKGVLLKSIIISNPLKQDLEYYNEDGKFEKKTVVMNTAPFMIRTEMTTNLNIIKIVDYENKLIATLTVIP